MYLAARNREKNTVDGVHLALAQDGEQWLDYLDRHSESVQELMKLTPNKRRCYQRAIRAANPMESTS